MDTKALRQKILDLATRGKLVPQDPNDEPASVLLERIRAEKQQMVKDGKLKPKDIKNDTIIFVGEDNLHYEKFQDGTVKCIEDEIPFEVPEGWCWCRLGSISAAIQYGLSNSAKQSGTHRLLRITDIQDGKVDWDTVPFTTVYEAENYLLSSGDIVFARTGATVGKSFLIKELPYPAVYASYLIRIRLLDGVLPDYIYQFFSSQCYWEQITDKSVGVGQPNCNGTSLKELFIPIPPFSEQNRIVPSALSALEYVINIELDKASLLETVTSIKFKILDLAIQGKLVPQNQNDEPASVLLERIRAEKEELIKAGKIKRDKKESVIFKGDDNSYYEKIGNEVTCIDGEMPFEIPEMWVWSRLGSLGIWGAGATPSRNIPEYYNGNIPWLKTGDLNDDYITYIPENISELALTNTSVRINPKGSVLIAMYGATIGKLGILTFPATTNQACCACIPFAGMENRYLFYYLLSQRENFIYRGVGGAQLNISKEKIVSTLIPLPPQNEQVKILEKIDRLFNLLSTVEQSLN